MCVVEEAPSGGRSGYLKSERGVGSMTPLGKCNGVCKCVRVSFPWRGNNMCKVSEKREWMAFKELDEVQCDWNIEFEGLSAVDCCLKYHLRIQWL